MLFNAGTYRQDGKFEMKCV